MFNFDVARLCEIMDELRKREQMHSRLAHDLKQQGVGSFSLQDWPDEKMASETFEMLSNIESYASQMQLEALLDRTASFRDKLEHHRISHAECYTELRVIRETFEMGLKRAYFFHYPNDKSKALKTLDADWVAVLAAFPSAKSDVHALVDTWALGHPIASVFHAMRVLEHGLRALASDVNKSFDVQNWQNIIDEIEGEIRAQGKALPRGVPKSERLQFLSEAAKEFVYFKDGWRNYVSHARGDYDEYQAKSIMDHVRSFMTALSSRLSE